MRLAGQAKAGFYPTPEPIYTTIQKYLVCKKNQSGGGLVRILDPCAGTGEPIASIAESFSNVKVETYGIEISQQRGEIAQKNLTKCLITDYQNTRISNKVFSILYLNPPYDDDTADDYEGLSRNDRHELIFLKSCIKYLMPQGILIYLIPQMRISRRIAKILAYNFENIRIFKFTPETYKDFKQIVIFAELKAKASKDKLDETWLVRAGRMELIAPDISISWLKNRYYVPQISIKQKKSSLIFSTNVIEPDELAYEVEKFGLINDLVKIFNSENVINLKTRPIMPMRHGHLAQALASGIMNGIVRDKNGENPLLVKGLTKKITDTREEKSGDNVKIIETERVKIMVNAFNREGELLVIE